MRTGWILAASLLIAPSAEAIAQPVSAPATRDRVVLEQRLRQRAAQLTRQRLGLNDTQMQQLERVNARFAPQLRTLAIRERDARQQLRREMTADQANQARVSALLDTTLSVQKQRIALIEAEQRELAAFLTPVQRARYISLQTQFRRRAEQLTRQRGLGRQRGAARRTNPRSQQDR